MSLKLSGLKAKQAPYTLQSQQQKAHSGIIVLELWHDQTLTKQVEYRPLHFVPNEINNGYADELVTNPARILIPKPTESLNGVRAIDHIVAKNGHLKVVKQQPNITDLIRTELLNNLNWPLNKKLIIEDLPTPFTVTAASNLLSTSYSMLPVNDPYTIFGIKKGAEEIVLDTTLLQGKTVRELIFNLIKIGENQSGLYHILPMPEPSDADYSTAKSFKWSIGQLNK